MNCPSCHTDIATHDKAGRELDFCIALKKGIIIEKEKGADLYYFINPGDGTVGWRGHTRQEIIEYGLLPTFSTSFAACEVLIEEMVDSLSMSNLPSCFVKDNWHVRVKVGLVYYRDFTAPILPHAISLAYLAFKGKEGGE